ncbi:hypothetical protein [Microcoleus sp. S13_C5]
MATPTSDQIIVTDDGLLHPLLGVLRRLGNTESGDRSVSQRERV